MQDVILQVLGGLLGGFLAGLFGVGGAIIYVPLLFFLGLSMKQAIGTSIAVVLPTALLGAYRHYKECDIDFRLVSIMGLSGLLAAYVGASVTALIPDQTLRLVFVAFVLISAFGIVVNKYLAEGKSYSPSTFKYVLAFFISLIAGFFSGLLGIGGGPILVSLPVLLLGLPIHVAVANSLCIIVFNSTAGLVGHLELGNVLFMVAIPLMFGSLVGVQIGAKLAHKLSPKNLALGAAILYMLVALKMLLG